MLPFLTELLPHINNTKNNNYMRIGEQQQSQLAILYVYNIHHAKYPFSTTIRYFKIAEIITYTIVPVVEYWIVCMRLRFSP